MDFVFSVNKLKIITAVPVSWKLIAVGLVLWYIGLNL